MSDHLRAQIRGAAKTLLMGLPTTGAQVKVGRKRPVGETHPDTLLVYTTAGREESKRAVAGRPPILERTCLLHVEGVVVTDADTAPDNKLDTIAKEAEERMATDTTLGGLALRVELAATDFDTDATGDRQKGGVRLEYRVTYRTVEGVPTAAA